MSSWLKHRRFLLARRTLQIVLIVLFMSGNYLGWQILRGNLSFSLWFNWLPMTDPFALAQMLLAGATLNMDLLLGVLISLFIYGLLFGRAFCSWVCPVNLISDLADWLRSKFFPERADTILQISRSLRYWLLALFLVLSVILQVAVFELINPISILLRGLILGFNMGWTVVVGLLLFDLLVLKNGFCGYLCPLGGFYAALGRFARLKVAHQVENCTMCMACIEICPEVQVLDKIGHESGLILDLGCTNCARCVEVCHDNALKMTFSVPVNKMNKNLEEANSV